MKIFFGLIFFLLLLIESVDAQVKEQSFTVTWDYSGNAPGNAHTGFRVERAPPGGSFAVIDTLPPDARTFSDLVTANIGDTFLWRVVAFNATQISLYSNEAAGTITSVPAPTVSKVVRNKNQCTFTLTGTPPDGLGGWSVQFRFTSTPQGAQQPFGAADPSEPFVVTANLKNSATYDFWGSWTKQGQPTHQSGHTPGSCP